MNPSRLGLLTWSDDPAHFVRTSVRSFARRAGASRSAATGDDRPHLRDGARAGPGATSLRRPVENVTHESYPWHVWYPLRRTGGLRAPRPARASARSCASTRRSAWPTARRSSRTTSVWLVTAWTPATTSSSSASSAASSTRCRTSFRRCARRARPASSSPRWGRSSSASCSTAPV